MDTKVTNHADESTMDATRRSVCDNWTRNSTYDEMNRSEKSAKWTAEQDGTYGDGTGAGNGEPKDGQKDRRTDGNGQE